MNMMKASAWLSAPVMLAAALFSSCDDDTAPPAKARLNLQVSTNRQPTTKTGREASVNQLVFTTGSIKFREVVFDADIVGAVGADTSISITHEQVAVIDYATGTITPAVVIEVPPGVYEDVYLGIEIQDEGANPSVVIEGTFTDSQGMAVPVRFEFNSGEVFEAEAERVTLTEGRSVIARITFDAQYWFGTITASQLENATRTNGRIVVSETSNVGIFGIVAQRLDDATDAVFQ
jgi:uncharacterized lipoprotein YbaY